MSSMLDNPIEARISAVWSADKESFLLPYMIAAFFDWILLGIVICLVIQWYEHRKEERRFVVICVVGLSSLARSPDADTTDRSNPLFHRWIRILDLLAYPCLRMAFRQYKEIARIRWVTQYSIIYDLSTSLVQLFYTERAYRINKNKKWIPLVVLLVIVITWAMHITSVVYSNVKYTFSSPEVYSDPIAKSGLYTWFCGALFVDVLITSCIAYGLYKQKSGWKETDHTITKLISVSLETQLPALISAIIIVSLWGRKLVVLIFLLPQPKVYIVGFLAVLNFRFARRGETSLTSRQHGAQVYPMDSATIRGAVPADYDGMNGEVRVDVETHVVTSPSAFGQGGPESPTTSPWTETIRTPLEYDNHSQKTVATGDEGFAAGSSQSELNDWVHKAGH